jgi:hypothetical protein
VLVGENWIKIVFMEMKGIEVVFLGVNWNGVLLME